MFGITLLKSSAINPASFILDPSLRSYTTPTNCSTLSNAFSIGDTFSLSVILDVSVSEAAVSAPPQYTAPEIPTPPATFKAPVVALVDAVFSSMII